MCCFCFCTTKILPFSPSRKSFNTIYRCLTYVCTKNSVTQPNESTPPRHTDNSELVVKNMF